MPPATEAPAPWVVLIHVFAVIGYAGGLLTVLRLLAQGAALPAEEERALAGHARRAYLATAFPAAVLMILAGGWMLLGDPGWAVYRSQGWMHMKLTLVLLLLVLDHLFVLRPMKRLARGDAMGAAAGRRTLYGMLQAGLLLLVGGVLAAVFLIRR